jgi:signal transduction histidine kinase
MGTVVRDASTRANALIESLLLLARTEAQTGRLSRQMPVDLGRGVPSTLAAVAAETRRLALRVTTDFAPALVIGDPGLLERLAGNLIENAVRYNVGAGTLSVRTGTENGTAFLIVANDGPDLDQSEVPGLFEPFRRGGVERTGTRGAGLGLSIVRAVAEAHGGGVTAMARSEGGLEVVVTLPAADAEPLVAVPAGAAGGPPAVPVGGATATTVGLPNGRPPERPTNPLPRLQPPPAPVRPAQEADNPPGGPDGRARGVARPR